ncbi:response regulator [Arenibaculum pallidiluteum]|uniref:response regulator n=1 Tax=Arenibaculum pallidiluteum TaxID=2812559 RepID=UPI001A96E7F9|nr:response regulator [Arenibaculum pallidiluteum]
MTRRVRVVVAEDELLIALALEAALVDLGYEVAAIAATAEDAVAAAVRHNVELALVDVRLAEGSDGLWAAQRLVRSYGIPVIVCSACTRPADALATGASAFLAKPYTAAQLRHALEAVSPLLQRELR